MDTINCTVCGAITILLDGKCKKCNSSPRQRAMALEVLRALKINKTSIQACKMDKSREGLGASDWFGLAAELANCFTYTNSFYHKYPQLDLSAPPEIAIGQFEFCTCSDVLERVRPPVERAFAGLFSILKPGGAAIVSVPTTERVTGIFEKYPNLHDFRTYEGNNGIHILENMS